MAADTQVLQDMADAMLPLFDNMPRVAVLVEDHEAFERDPYPAAIYSCPNIIINPPFARTCTFSEMQDTLCHELIHAWLDWKGLLGTGELLDDHHSEWFVKKALEINQKKIDNLNVDVDYLLGTSKAIDIYNRVAGIQFAPYLRHKVRKIWKTVAAYTTEIVGMFLERDRFSKGVAISFSVVIVSTFLNRAHYIPDPVASFVWVAWSCTIIVLLAVRIIRQRKR